MDLRTEPSQLARDDHRAFYERLETNLRALELLLARPGFGEGPPTLGARLELDLIDELGRPLPCSESVVAALREARAPVHLEVDRFDLEIEAPPVLARARPFSELGASLRGALRAVERAAGELGGHVAVIGILPTLAPADLEAHDASRLARFRSLDRGFAAAWRGPHAIDIEGPEPLTLPASDVVTEGASTSFQLCLRAPPAEFADLYNAVQLASAPVLAVAGNSPTFLGHRLWSETRVALFGGGGAGSERPDLRALGTFGHGWTRRSAMELFRECAAMHAPVLPEVGDEDALAISSGGWVPALEELCLHTKTQWRWNRPAYAFEDGGHLGVELRSLPAGPSVGDMIANAAFATGLAYALAPQIEEHLCRITFGQARRSFFAAARDGLEAELAWPAFDGLSPRPRRARDLVIELLPLAAEGLASLGVEDDEAHELLGIIERRASSGQTGSVWQVSAVTALERRMSRDEALRKMLVAYVRRASTGQPVHSWAPLDEHREGGPT